MTGQQVKRIIGMAIRRPLVPFTFAVFVVSEPRRIGQWPALFGELWRNPPVTCKHIRRFACLLPIRLLVPLLFIYALVLEPRLAWADRWRTFAGLVRDPLALDTMVW